MHVQKLNKLQAENVKTPIYDSESSISETEECLPEVDNRICRANKSKWSNYINTAEETTDTNEPMYIHNQEVVLEIPKKAKIRKIQSKQYQYNSPCEIDEAGSPALLNTSHEYHNTLEIDTTLTQQKLGAKTQIWKPPFNNTKHSENNNSFTESNIKNVRENTRNSYKSYFSSSKEEVQYSHANEKETEIQKTKKSKWDDFIEDEEQISLNDTCEDETCSQEFLHNSISQTQTSLKLEAGKNSNTISSDEENNVINHFSQNSKTKNYKSVSLFSISNDCDLDDILNF